MDIMVFDKGIYLGTFTVPKISKEKLICIYEGIFFKGNAPIDIMYFQDLNYGITITDEIKNYCKDKCIFNWSL